jgi:hypothetical protein
MNNKFKLTEGNLTPKQLDEIRKKVRKRLKRLKVRTAISNFIKIFYR